MHEALGFISSTGRWEIQRKHDSGLWVVQKLLALLLESALMEKRGHKHWKGWHLAAWFELTAYLHFLGDPWVVKDKTLTSTEVWEDDVLSENTTWWGLWGPRLFAMCVLRLISKGSSEEEEPLQSLNKPHGLPWTVRPGCHVMAEKGYYQPEEREHGLSAVLPTAVTEQLAPVREERSNFDSRVLGC